MENQKFFKVLPKAVEGSGSLQRQLPGKKVKKIPNGAGDPRDHVRVKLALNSHLGAALVPAWGVVQY